MHKGQRVAFSLCPCASSLKCPSPPSSSSSTCLCHAHMPLWPCHWAPPSLPACPARYVDPATVAAGKLRKTQFNNDCKWANAACSMQHAAACNMQRAVCVCVCVCCAVFASCLCQILWPKGAFEMKSTGNCNCICPKIFDALLMRLAMLHYLAREGQLNLLTDTHTHIHA